MAGRPRAPGDCAACRPSPSTPPSASATSTSASPTSTARSPSTATASASASPPTAAADGLDAAFLAAGDYHHHIGLNTWESAGATPPPPGHTGLYHVAFLYPDRARARPRRPAAARPRLPDRPRHRPRRHRLRLPRRPRRQRRRALLRPPARGLVRRRRPPGPQGRPLRLPRAARGRLTPPQPQGAPHDHVPPPHRGRRRTDARRSPPVAPPTPLHGGDHVRTIKLTEATATVKPAIVDLGQPGPSRRRPGDRQGRREPPRTARTPATSSRRARSSTPGTNPFDSDLRLRRHPVAGHRPRSPCTGRSTRRWPSSSPPSPAGRASIAPPAGDIDIRSEADQITVRLLKD